MAHLEKFTKNAVSNLLRHFDRTANNISNLDIKKELTEQNYNCAKNTQSLSAEKFMKQRLSEVKIQNRKDVNLLCDWCLTAPQKLKENEHNIFFKKSYEFLENRYGKENVVSAWVHLDETTPHMHFAFIPVTEDKKKDRYKVSAKEVCNRKDLKSFHSDLNNHLTTVFGRNIGIINGATVDGNKTKKELQQQEIGKLENQLLKTETELMRVSQDVTFAEYDLQNLESKIQNQSDQLKQKEHLLNRVTERLSSVNLQKEKIRAISQIEHKPLWNDKNKVLISVEDFNYLQKMAHKALVGFDENHKLKEQVGKLQEQNQKLHVSTAEKIKDKNKISDLEHDIKYLSFEKENLIAFLEKQKLLEKFIEQDIFDQQGNVKSLLSKTNFLEQGF